MLSKAQKQRIKLYNPKARARSKAERRRMDAKEAASGRAAEVQERNRALPPAAVFVFSDSEEALPTE